MNQNSSPQIIWFNSEDEIIQKIPPQKSRILVDKDFLNLWPLLLNSIEKSSVFVTDKNKEQNKSIETVLTIWDWLLNNKTSRHHTMYHLGGGVTTDLGGFVSSTYKRGLPFVHIPTTLLCMVDACYGGKTAINYKGIKNTIGVFTNPTEIWMCTDFLKTLPPEEIRNGFAEMFKHGLIGDAQHWMEAVNTYPKYNKTLINNSLNIKIQITLEDPFDKNSRQKLNFGHSVGHAIESFSHKLRNKAMNHGDAIAIGMIVESYIAESLGLLAAEKREKIQQVLGEIYGPYLTFSPDEYINALLDFLMQDKKNTESDLQMSLLTDIGECSVHQSVTVENVQNALRSLQKMK